MKAPLWVIQLAAEFWAIADVEEPFPRNLRRAVVRVFADGGVVPLPNMTVGVVRDWLREQGIPPFCEGRDRLLRACLVAHAGGGMIFIDSSDPVDEQRFSLAHELAHWLREYWKPRRSASEHLGPTILEVFDGKRPATVAEKLHSLVAGVPVGCHIHFMERTRTGAFASRQVAEAEADADRLAYELLAPAEVIAHVTRSAQPTASSLACLLRADYGLPGEQAAAYAKLLSPSSRPTDPVLLRLLRDT